MDSIVEAVVAAIEGASDPATQEGAQRFFREPVRVRGAKTPAVRAIARTHWARVAGRPATAVLALCEDLYRTGYLEDGFVAADWAERLAPTLGPEAVELFGGWVDRYVDTWAACDTLCNHAVGDLVARYPETIAVLRTWAQSRNRWMRRAAAVSLVVPAKRGEFLDEVLAIADLVLLDENDMVRKGYGWLLKEASRRHRDEVYAFVLARRATMPRTALRYAVELMPPGLRAEAMRRV